MMGPWKSAAGMLEVEVTSADPSGALDAASKAGIALFHARPSGELSVMLGLRRRDYRKMRRLCQKRGETLRILRRQGVYWTWKAMLRRPVLLTGLSVFLGLCLYLPRNIYFIQVEGNRAVPSRLILERAEECGIRFGAGSRGCGVRK